MFKPRALTHAQLAEMKYLTKDAHPELQMGAVSALADTERREAAKMLQESLNQLAPGNRKLAAEAITRLQARNAKP